MTAVIAPSAPAHLKAATRLWWESVITSWDLAPHHVRLLTLAAVCWDRGEAARKILETSGLIVETKAGGPRAHPAVKIEETARLQFARLLRELDLDIDAPAAASRPAPLRSVR